MDEGTLNDLLECSVCLERLDTSSKVLPCQHTFCKKCLDEIVLKHKELKCPECRVLVTVKVDDLPPNVLLMRILEGMKNATPNGLKFGGRKVVQQNLLQQTFHQQPVHVPEQIVSPNKINTLVHHQPYAKALYDYAAKEPGDLTFKRGDTIILRRRIDNNWYHGECNGQQGVFPLSYVQIITPVPSHLPQCKALYDFRMTNDEEEGCLMFKKGDVINVIRRVDENWAEGKLDGKIGIFPLAFVEMNNLARSLMKLSTNAQPGPSKVAPPTPTNDDSTPLIPTDHSKNLVQQPVIPASDSNSTISSGSSSTTTPNVSSSNNSSSSSAPSSPASPPSRPPGVANRSLNVPESLGRSSTPQRTVHHPQQHQKEKRHSFTGATTASHHQHHRLSAEFGPESATANVVVAKRAPQSSEGQLPAAYIALYPYKPQKADELELKRGDVYMVSDRCQDGWFKGTSNRTQKSGVFPGNYVSFAHGIGAAQSISRRNGSGAPPELPPRSGNHNTNNTDKSKDRKEKSSTVSLMKRLASIKRPKSPPTSSYSMDNPVFEDATTQPVHVRSGSCPSQLLQLHPNDHHRLPGSSSQRLKHKERPTVLPPYRTTEAASAASASHKKSNSLDAGNRHKAGSQSVRERYRCIAPYPPNSEYELELHVDDIIYVHKKRDDGWYKGTQQRTGKTGLFPASFVEGF